MLQANTGTAELQIDFFTRKEALGDNARRSGRFARRVNGKTR